MKGVGFDAICGGSSSLSLDGSRIDDNVGDSLTSLD